MTRAEHTARVRSRWGSRAAGLVSLTALLAASGSALAQADLTPKLPNVLLLVDTSGSMEYQIDGSEVVCTPDNEAGENDKSRWIELVEVLTGSIDDDHYSCETIDRLSAEFRDGEYGLDGDPPYDYQYTVPFHRMLSNGCAAKPGTLPGPNAFRYPSGGIAFKHFSTNADCTFTQDSNGILDEYGSTVRFGLMTFDTQTDPGTGFSGTSPVLSTGVAGTWSYIVGSSIQGAPRECDPTDQEVGARNAAAPPWEGRMVNFGNPAPGENAHLTKRQQIEEILRATRPFGATPIAGMLKDAEDFFTLDASIDQDPIPSDANLPFGPKDDPYAACRDRHIVLLTDGAPNLDLRPECEGSTTATCPADDPDCRCPFELPQTITARMAAADKPITTHVIGFALATVTVGSETVDCNDEEALAELCSNPSHADNYPLQACCTLKAIADAGGGEIGLAASAATLREKLDVVLSRAVPNTSRTQPTFSSSTGGIDHTARFFTSFRPMPAQPWPGVLERQRWDCVPDPDNINGPEIPVPLEIKEEDGDKFAANLASDPTARKFYTIYGGRSDTDSVDPEATIRPHIDGNIDVDGLGTNGGRVAYGTPQSDGSSFASGTHAPPAAALDIPAGRCASMTQDQCRAFYLNWLMGNVVDGEYQRCKSPNTATCNLLGDIFHSTPRVVGRPTALLRDESYAAYAFEQRFRPDVVYVSTNDGILHAFKAFSNDPAETENSEKVLTKTQNELWAFIPPAILPELHSLYPASHHLLLDGVPVVKDVPAIELDDGTIVLERTAAVAQAGTGKWRTILVQSFGGERSGYFALDVTNPVETGEPDALDTDGGPKFLWQITKDKAGEPLFGEGGGTPLITTLFFDAGDEPTEVAVAVLPGGPGGEGNAGSGAGCPEDEARDFDGLGIDGEYEPRGRVMCYSSEFAGAHSLTIVRLDTGEIVRTFRRDASEVHADLEDKVSIAFLDSPITGQPVGFPSDPGAVSDRIFVGDADGRVWKVDVSSTDPEQWEMNLFFDTFPAEFPSGSGHDFDDGQPIQTAPILSVDDRGNITVNVSTGDQDSMGTAPGMKNYVWSLTETLSNDRTSFSTKANWFLALNGGERVTGPMAIFARNLYFSSFTPPTSDLCDAGSSRVWGMDYITVKSDGSPVGPGNGGNPAPGFEIDGFISADELGGDSDEDPVIFGVTVAQTPSCANLPAETTEDWLGFGAHQSLTKVNPGKFQLLIQTGVGGTLEEGAETRSTAIDLQSPPALSSVDSWAAILE